MSDPPSTPTPPTDSLLSAAAMGGIVAGKGFDFQARYAVCHLPQWLSDRTFHQLFFEGTGDIDVRFIDNGRSTRRHIQAKDHDVTPAEFRQVIESFQALDAGFPGVYQAFTLACPSLSPQLRSIEAGLARLRQAKPFYDDVPAALTATSNDLTARMRQQGLDDTQLQFVRDKVLIEAGLGYLTHDDRATDQFIAALQKHPDFSQMLRTMVQPAYAQMMHSINTNKGRVLERAVIEAVLHAAVLPGSSSEKSLTVWIHNWTKEAFEPPADFELDWSPKFDRASRQVPPQDVWNAELIPQFDTLRKAIIAAGAARTIRFRGKCALSTGVALGATFPAVGGWIFEIPQPPAKEPWRSDAPPTSGYDLQTEVVEGRADGTDLVVGLNIRGDGRQDVIRYIESTGSPPSAYVFMAPPSQGAQSIGGAADACAMALMIRDRLGQILKQRQLRTTRLFFYGPFALSVFLGQQLTAVGQVRLYEYKDPGYVPSCLLRT